MSSVHTQLLTDDASGILLERSFRLRVVGGPDHGKEHMLDEGTTMVGTHADNDLVLADATVSRYHLEIRVRRDGIEIRDLDTTNGTKHGGARVGQVVLTGAARLRLGKHTEVDVEPVDQSVELSEWPSDRFGDVLGTSIPMKQLFALLAKAAPTEATILLTGETGTGKEAIAESVHHASRRAKGPFIVVDCGSIPHELIASELFGHAKGSFTGAGADKQGLIEAANKGTLFLDEIGELAIDLQPQLLRVLDRRQVRRVGETQSVDVDIRVIAATHRDLRAMVRAGTFREDLYYRLAVVATAVPPLRERKSDIAALATWFADRMGRGNFVQSPALVDQLQRHDWPGNVRELRNVVERALSLGAAALADLGGEPRLPSASDSAPALSIDGRSQARLEPRRARAAVQRGQGAAGRSVRTRLPVGAARAPPRQHLARRRRGRHRSQLYPPPGEEVRARSRPIVKRAVYLALVFAAACSGKKQHHAVGSGSDSHKGSASAVVVEPVVPVDWPACEAALRQAATAPLDNRPELLIDGCKVCGEWTPILKWQTTEQGGGPSRNAIRSAMERCHAYCSGQAKQHFLGTLDDARGTTSHTPWRTLGEVCKGDVSALPDNRFTSAPLFALDRIARAATAHGGDAANLVQAIELPLPALSLTGVGIVMPDVESDVTPTAGPIAITLTGGAMYLAKLPRAHMTATGLAVDLGGYPGDAVKPEKLADALAKLADPSGGIVAISILAPTATPAETILPIVGVAAKVAPVYLAANAANAPEGWELPGNIPVALEIGTGKAAFKISHELTTQNLATELAARAKAGTKKLALAASK